jgi:putative transposase
MSDPIFCKGLFLARPRRIEFAGAWYYVRVHGNGGRDIFTDEREKKKFCEYLGRAHERFGVLVHAYCLLSDRYYLLLETPQANLARSMQYLNASYTTYFNIKHERVGHLIHGRYHAVIIEPDVYALPLSNFLHVLPAREKLCIHPADYFASSCAAYSGRCVCPQFLNTQCIYALVPERAEGVTENENENERGASDRSAAEKYAEYLQHAADAVEDDPAQEASDGAVLGSDDFIAKIRERDVKRE